MSYSINPNLEKARGNALKELLIEKRKLTVVARRYGVHRTTIYRWYIKWKEINSLELKNYNRPSRKVNEAGKLKYARWTIKTLSSAPKHHPKRIDDNTIRRILELRSQYSRCSEIIWYELIKEGYKISLTSVKRTLERHHQLNKWSKWKRYHKTTERPLANTPGDLVEIDTIHLFNPVSKEKRYIYTVIDLYTRMAYARVYKELKPINSLNTILEAEQYFGFKFKMVQSDNGLEFARYFETRLESRGIKIRHTRLGRPNDNAHIERFNRTLQEECTGNYYLESESLKTMDDKILSYIDFYNYHRIHLSISYRTPAEMLHRL